MQNNTFLHKSPTKISLNPNKAVFEVVERKFRGHPDSLADMVAQSFTQKYIYNAWKVLPELKNNYFPNFSSDKIVLSGSSTRFKNGKCDIMKPVDALLIGKITQDIGTTHINIDSIFKDAIETILTKCLGHNDYRPYIKRKIYSVSLAGSDHNMGFYQPNSVGDLINILKDETHANDTVYVVAYSPLSVTEKLVIYLDNLTASKKFRTKFPEIGSDIKVMVRRRSLDFDITMCLPIFPEKVSTISLYNNILKEATDYLCSMIMEFLCSYSQEYKKSKVKLHTNTKDTKDKKYFAIWGTALSKGDIGAVGRGNRQQGFISGIRPSTNEAMSGKNPNHFAGIVYQLVAENISQLIYRNIGLKNIVYITANNGNLLSSPNSIDIELEDYTSDQEKEVNKVVRATLKAIPKLRMDFINSNPYDRFMKSNIL